MRLLVPDDLHCAVNDALKAFDFLKYSLLVVNNLPPGTSIYIDDDSKETNLSTAAAANMLFTSDLTDFAKSATPQHKAIAGNAELEELGVLFRDYHKALFPAKAALLLSITSSRRLNLRFQNLIKFCS